METYLREEGLEGDEFSRNLSSLVGFDPLLHIGFRIYISHTFDESAHGFIVSNTELLSAFAKCYKIGFHGFQARNIQLLEGLESLHHFFLIFLLVQMMFADLLLVLAQGSLSSGFVSIQLWFELTGEFEFAVGYFTFSISFALLASVCFCKSNVVFSRSWQAFTYLDRI